MRKQIARYNTLPPPPLEAGIRQKLAGHFRDDLERLETLLDIDLSAWRSHAHIDDESKGVLELHPA